MGYMLLERLAQILPLGEGSSSTKVIGPGSRQIGAVIGGCTAHIGRPFIVAGIPLRLLLSSLRAGAWRGHRLCIDPKLCTGSTSF